MAVIAPTTGAYSYLLNKDVNFIRESYPVPTDTGVPAYYALFGPNSNDEAELTFMLGPTPDVAYTMELHYFYRPASLTSGSDSGTTWLSTNAELTLLYGSLIEAYVFMKGDPDLMAKYDQRFQESLMGLKQLGEARQVTDEYRTGVVVRTKQ